MSDAPCYIPTDVLEVTRTADEIAAAIDRPIWPVWRALQRDCKRGRVARVVGEDLVTRYHIADRKRRSGKMRTTDDNDRDDKSERRARRRQERRDERKRDATKKNEEAA
jgi:hypothetical protein